MTQPEPFQIIKQLNTTVTERKQTKKVKLKKKQKNINLKKEEKNQANLNEPLKPGQIKKLTTC